MSSESDGDDDDANNMTREEADCHYLCDIESLPSLASESDSDDDEDSIDVEFRSGFEDMPPLEECDSFDDSLTGKGQQLRYGG